MGNAKPREEASVSSDGGALESGCAGGAGGAATATMPEGEPTIAGIADMIERDPAWLRERMGRADPGRLAAALRSLDELVGMETTKRAVVDQLCFLIESRGDTGGHLLHTLVVGPPGTGKCLATGTRVTMADGEACSVDEIVVGDLVLGGDGLSARRVRSVCRGHGALYDVLQEAPGLAPYTVNADHVLCLVWTGDGEHDLPVVACDGITPTGRIIRVANDGAVVDVPLLTYLALPEAVRTRFRGCARAGPDDLLLADVSVRRSRPPSGDYCGFEIDGDGRFLLADGTVTHNTSLARILAEVWCALGVVGSATAVAADHGKGGCEGTATPDAKDPSVSCRSGSCAGSGIPPNRHHKLSRDIPRRRTGPSEPSAKRRRASEDYDADDDYAEAADSRRNRGSGPGSGLSPGASDAAGTHGGAGSDPLDEGWQAIAVMADRIEQVSDSVLEMHERTTRLADRCQVLAADREARSRKRKSAEDGKLPEGPAAKRRRLSPPGAYSGGGVAACGRNDTETEVSRAEETCRSAVATLGALHNAAFQAAEVMFRASRRVRAPGGAIPRVDGGGGGRHGPRKRGPRIGSGGSGGDTDGSARSGAVCGFGGTPGGKRAGNVRVVSRSHFVAEYMGQTAAKTQRALEESVGCVVIVEESYSLYQGERDAFGAEALHVILQWMTERPRDVVFIFLGYGDALDRTVFQANAGLRRRFGWTFDVPSYSPAQLARIFAAQVVDRGDGGGGGGGSGPDPFAARHDPTAGEKGARAGARAAWQLDGPLLADGMRTLEAFMTRHVSALRHFGGDTHRLLFHCKLVHSRWAWAGGRGPPRGMPRVITAPVLHRAMDDMRANVDRTDCALRSQDGHPIDETLCRTLYT